MNRETSAMSEHDGALAGLKVLDFSWAVAGPMTTRVLAVHGATVVKVESNLRLDGTRVGPPFKGKPSRNASGYYADINPNKLSVTLNMGHEDAFAIAKRFVQWADVVCENFRPGVMHRWGLDYEQLKAVKPEIIMMSSSMQGAVGPNATHPGLGGTLGALVGVNNFVGWPDAEPIGMSHPYTDVVGPWFAVTAILGALEHRDRTGLGQFIDLSQFEATMHMMAPALLDYAANGRVQQRMGNRSPHYAPHGAYRCQGDSLQGDWVAIAVTNDKQWQSFKQALGKPAWADDPRFETALGRIRAADELDTLIEQWTTDYTPLRVEGLLQERGVPAAVVATARELHADPQLAHLGILPRFDHPRLGDHALTHPAFRLSKTPSEMRRGDLIGEHSEYAYKTFIGMSDAEYNAGVQSGLIQ